MSVGVLYIATGQRYFDEACLSAESVKRHMPDLPVTIVTDQDRAVPYFDSVIRVESSNVRFKDKPLFMSRTPYDHTLFLDSDTYVCGDLKDLFPLLAQFDMAAVHDYPWRLIHTLENVPDSFPEYNSGMLLFKKSPAMETFFAEWMRLYEEITFASKRDFPADQPSFRIAVYYSNLRIASLMAEYNCRFPFFGFVNAPVKILHGREHVFPYTAASFERIVQAINRSPKPRVFTIGKVYEMQFGTSRLLHQVVRHSRYSARLLDPVWKVMLRRVGAQINKRGVLGTVQFALKTLRKG